MFFFLLNINVNWYIYCYIDTTNFTIFSFSTVVLHCSYSVFHCSSTVPFWLATFFFSLLFVLFFPLYIYSVFALCVHYSCNSALVSWVLFYFILFFFSNQFVFFFLLNIDVSWHLYYYTDTTNFTIIDVSISYKVK